ncbi:MAG: RNA methyltransferase [Pseudomonadota bacterium]
MPRLKQEYEQQGFYGIGLIHSVKDLNIGTLWRSAYILGASFIFTVGNRYRTQGSDVTKSWLKIPLYHYDTMNALYDHLPHDTRLVAVEMAPQATPLKDFVHPPRAVYLLGNEQVGLPPGLLADCHAVVSLPGAFSLNVSVAGSLVMYDRICKISHSLPQKSTPVDLPSPAF